jgi:hypothetical protein
MIDASRVAGRPRTKVTAQRFPKIYSAEASLKEE